VIFLIYTFLSPREAQEWIIEQRQLFVKQFNVSVVIDVLRATSTVITALSNGAKSIIPVSTVEQALDLKHRHPEYIIAGERGGEKIEGFQLGNSPTEYTEAVVRDKTIVLTTSNGTNAIIHASNLAERVLIASFLNLTTVVHELDGYDSSTNIVIVCAGNNGEISYEDTQVAGAIISKLIKERVHYLSDSSKIAMKLWDALKKPDFSGEHAKKLSQLGFDKDLELCQKVDYMPILAELRDCKIIKVE
jgi:2-phosphosulfolactate phosphatase